MGRHQKYFDYDVFLLVRSECLAYINRCRVIDTGRADKEIINGYAFLNEKFDSAVSFLETRERRELIKDIAYGYGWCRSQLISCMSMDTYKFHKRSFIAAVAKMLGE